MNSQCHLREENAVASLLLLVFFFQLAFFRKVPRPCKVKSNLGYSSSSSSHCAAISTCKSVFGGVLESCPGHEIVHRQIPYLLGLFDKKATCFFDQVLYFQVSKVLLWIPHIFTDDGRKMSIHEECLNGMHNYCASMRCNEFVKFPTGTRARNFG